MNTVSFPNLPFEFLQNISLNRVAFTIKNIEIYWYGIILTAGIIAAFLFVLLRSGKEGIKSDDIYDMAIFTILFAVIGARLYYVLTKLDDFLVGDIWDTLKAIVNVRSGGLAIYGAIIGGAVTSLIVCRVKKLNILKVYDILCPAVMLGQIIGRWGNFINAEAYGSLEKYVFFGLEWATPNASSLPTVMEINKGFNIIQAHPTFLYESLWNVLGFIILCVIINHKKYDGQVFLTYFAFYGVGRAFIEGFRTDSLMVGNIRISQFVGFSAFIACTLLLIFFAIKKNALNLHCGPAYYKKAASESEYADEVKCDELPEETDADADEVEKNLSKDTAANTDSDSSNITSEVTAEGTAAENVTEAEKSADDGEVQ